MNSTTNTPFIDRDAEIRQDNDGFIHLSLYGSQKWRIIGRVNRISKYFEKWEHPPHGLHHESDSFSLPYSLLLWLKENKIKGIKIIYENINYVTTVDNWLEKGDFLYFKGRTEKKLYLQRQNFKG